MARENPEGPPIGRENHPIEVMSAHSRGVDYRKAAAGSTLVRISTFRGLDGGGRRASGTVVTGGANPDASRLGDAISLSTDDTDLVH